MKLTFIKPKDKIELLKDGLISKSDKNHSFKNYFIKALYSFSEIFAPKNLISS